MKKIEDLTDRELDVLLIQGRQILWDAEYAGHHRLARGLRAKLELLEAEEQARLAEDLEPVVWPH